MKICLCGSTKYKDDYQTMNLALSKSGQVVYSVAGFGHSGDDLTAEEKETLDLVHLQKILFSDIIIVVGESSPGVPYIGDSTRREIKWAEMNERPVFYQHQVWDAAEQRLKEIDP